MDLSKMYERRSALSKQLDETISYRKKLSKELPEAERKYRKAMSETIVKLNAGDIEDYGKVAWTACYDIAKGINHKLMYKRDSRKYMYETTQEKIYALKLQIRIIDEDIKAIRHGNV